MATYNVTDQTSARRVQFTGNGTAGPFAFAFQVNATSEVKVYVDSTEKTETTHYTVTINSSTGAGTISFTSGNHPTNSQTITILGDIPLSRTSVYTSGGQFTASSLEDDFDTNMFIHQQTNEEINRSLRQAEHDVLSGADMTLPVKDTRKGKLLGFNETTGNPEATFNTADGQTLSNIASDIATLADIEDGTDATDAIQTVAGIAGNVTTVAGIQSAVSAVSSNSTNINAVNSNATNINKVATIDANVTKVADIDSDVTAVANIDSNVTTVAGKASLITSAFASGMSLVTSDFVSDVNTLAVTDVINDINTLATSDIVSDLNTLATSDIVSDINTLATSDIVSDLNTLATSDIVSDINLLATTDVVADLALLATSDFVSDLNTLATSTNVTNIATVATNVAGVNSFAERYRVGSSLPTTSLDQGDLFFNTTENELRAYNGTAWQATAPSAQDQVNINIVAGEIVSIEDLGSIADSVDTSSGNNIDTVANNISNVNSVGGISSNVTTVAGIAGNVTTVAGVASNVTAVANNITGLNSFAERYRVASSAPTSSLDAGDLYFNTSTNTLNYYNGSSFVAVVAGAMTSLVVDSTPQLGGNLDVNGNSIVSVSNGDITIAPNGSGEINLNGTVNTDNLIMDFGSIA